MLGSELEVLKARLLEFQPEGSENAAPLAPSARPGPLPRVRRPPALGLISSSAELMVTDP